MKGDSKYVCLEVQRDPYYYFQTQAEKQSNKNLVLRFAFNSVAIGTAGLYFVTRNQELHRLRNLSFSANLIFGLFWRSLIAYAVADTFSRRIFVNYQKVLE